MEDSDEMEEEGMQWPLGWRQLSGYVVAASIGIGVRLFPFSARPSHPFLSVDCPHERS